MLKNLFFSFILAVPVFGAGQALSLAAPNWSVVAGLYNYQGSLYYLPVQPAGRPGGAPVIAFTFNDAASGLFDGYLMTSTGIAPMAYGQTITINFEVDTTGAPVLNGKNADDNTCPFPPPSVHVYLSSAYAPEQFISPEWQRWFTSVAPYITTLAPGKFTMSIPLTPTGVWTDVYGNTPGDTINLFGFDGLAETLAVPTTMGITFGGGCFAAHGVQVNDNPDGSPTGTVTIKVLSIQVQ